MQVKHVINTGYTHVVDDCLLMTDIISRFRSEECFLNCQFVLVTKLFSLLLLFSRTELAFACGRLRFRQSLRFDVKLIDFRMVA